MFQIDVSTAIERSTAKREKKEQEVVAKDERDWIGFASALLCSLICFSFCSSYWV